MTAVFGLFILFGLVTLCTVAFYYYVRAFVAIVQKKDHLGILVMGSVTLVVIGLVGLRLQ